MKKCLVLDLDNTLWGGVLGEEGQQGIQLGMTPLGSSFIAFQQAILDLHDRGIILAINSKNNYDEAVQMIDTHPNMILKSRHFSALKINWNSKVENLKEIAKELNIGTDSMVFLDDDPTNRAMVHEYMPEVSAPDLPVNPSDYTKFLSSLTYFDTTTITNEDRMRGNFYVTERLRQEAEKSFTTKEDFLQSLGIELEIHKNSLSAVPRLAQLTEKTNQFNTNKNPLSEAEIYEFISSNTHTVYHAKAIDKFGDHGIIAFAHISTSQDRWHINTFLLSCRVLGRGIEDAFIHAIKNHAHAAGVHNITISFTKSDRNAPAEEFINKKFLDGTLQRETLAPPWITIRYANI